MQTAHCAVKPDNQNSVIFLVISKTGDIAKLDVAISKLKRLV